MHQYGFTLVELIIALMIASVVMAAVVTLANAAVNANQATDLMGREQAQLRLVLIRLTDLIRRANQVTAADIDSFQLWHDNNADGLKTADELTQISRGTGGNTLQIDSIDSSEVYTQCRNISFDYDSAAPQTRKVTIWFDITAAGQSQRYSIVARLRASDEHQKL